jgi:hypothetical protein
MAEKNAEGQGAKAKRSFAFAWGVLRPGAYASCCAEFDGEGNSSGRRLGSKSRKTPGIAVAARGLDAAKLRAGVPERLAGVPETLAVRLWRTAGEFCGGSAGFQGSARFGCRKTPGGFPGEAGCPPVADSWGHTGGSGCPPVADGCGLPGVSSAGGMAVQCSFSS